MSACPGGEACRADTEERVRRADAELSRRRAAGEPADRWATRAADYYVSPKQLDMFLEVSCG